MDKHRRHVQYITDKGLLRMTSEHTFACMSVTHQNEGVMYSGCIGELSCSCEYTGVCKHLEAANQLQPFTHSTRQQAAGAIVSRAGVQLTDAETGLAEYK